ncbi:p-loop containing nucleoside triphosphate hydrolase-13 [Coleophoma cylindrospora]|uniref:GTP-binding protein n=1 Tax=Coleophoma cylindrospora TaxID=1849047 RepID=A0A3D8SEE2_9HELO|nr:p-loop containing nucleoside triphosphate hydrolase-13 [Coleophoma cylindrospora]
MDGTYNGPARQGPVRFVSPVTLNLERIYTQNRINIQKRHGRVPEPAPGPAAKGKPRLLLMGQRRSGKSSISSVVFNKMPPNETLFLESTARVQKEAMRSFMDFQVWDFPGQLDFFDPNFDQDAVFGEIGALIWVIDAQDEYLDAINRLNMTILNIQPAYSNINIEVFIHKVDGLSEDYKLDIQRDIMQRIQDELSDHGFENAPINFHLTSIYNHSIFEAFSKVIQKLIPHLPTLEALLNDLCRSCRFEKAYLFDIVSKIYVATDSSPVDMPSYEICSDYIDVIVDVSEIFGWAPRPEDYVKALEGPPWNKKLEDQTGCGAAESCIVLTDQKRPIMLREVNTYLVLVAIMKEGSYEKMPLVTMNVETVVKGLLEVLEITKQRNGVEDGR